MTAITTPTEPTVPVPPKSARRLRCSFRDNSTSFLRLRCCLAVLCLLPATALAHDDEAKASLPARLMEQGGLAYPDLLLPLALGLLTGLRGPRHTLTAALALSLAWPTGGLLGTKLDHPSWTPFVTAAITVALGLLIALNRDLPRWTTALAAAIAGLAFGFASAPRVWSETPGATFAATGVAMALLTLPPAGAAMAARPDWSKIVVRVAGSWIAAIGLLLIGWAAKA